MVEFDHHNFSAAVDIMILAQDILVDLAGYPTESIARNSHDYRPLGLGYANLGALLMSMGLAYDSDAWKALRWRYNGHHDWGGISDLQPVGGFPKASKARWRCKT